MATFNVRFGNGSKLRIEICSQKSRLVIEEWIEVAKEVLSKIRDKMESNSESDSEPESVFLSFSAGAM